MTMERDSYIYDREFEEIQDMLYDMSDNLLAQIESRPVDLPPDLFTSKESYTVNCSHDEFDARLQSMSIDDLEETVQLLQRELKRVDNRIRSNSDTEAERCQLLDKKNLLHERLNACTQKSLASHDDFVSMYLTRLTSVLDEPVSPMVSPTKPRRFITRASVHNDELSDMSVAQLKVILDHHSVNYSPNSTRDDLLTRIDHYILRERDRNQNGNIVENMRELSVAEDDQIIMLTQQKMTEWDPTTLLQQLYSKYLISLPTKQSVQRIKAQSMQGYLDKLPINQSKAKAFKGWKKRYFKISSGLLFYYESHLSTMHLGNLDLRGATVEEEDGKIISIKSQLHFGENKFLCGKSLLLKCSSDAELADWLTALKASPKPTQKEMDLVIVDLGSFAVRAGRNESPELCFPSAFSVKNHSGQNKRSSNACLLDPNACKCGFEAFYPSNRSNATMVYPLKPTLNIDQYSINVQYVPLMLEKIFYELGISPKDKTVLISCPKFLSNSDKSYIMDHLFHQLDVYSVCMQGQALLALYSYSSTTGVIVDIGDHLDVYPVIEGAVIESGSTSLPAAGQQITERLSKLLTEDNYRFFSGLESFVVTRIKEAVCEFSTNGIKDDTSTVSVDVSKFNLPYDKKSVTVGDARHRCVEGLFRPSDWGKDHPPLHKMVEKAIKACDIDKRRDLCRNIYLSGGTTNIKGLPERLESELKALFPQNVQVKVSASPTRLNASYKGAYVLSGLTSFEQVCISRTEWDNQSAEVLLRRW